MDLRKIKKLIEMLEESNLSEIEIKEGEESVRLSRQIAYAPQMAMMPQMMAAAAAPAAPAPVASAAVAAAAPAASSSALPEGHVVRSPMVGTFYSSQAPGQPALAKVGQTVIDMEFVRIHIDTLGLQLQDHGFAIGFELTGIQDFGGFFFVAVWFGFGCARGILFGLFLGGGFRFEFLFQGILGQTTAACFFLGDGSSCCCWDIRSIHFVRHCFYCALVAGCFVACALLCCCVMADAAHCQLACLDTKRGGAALDRWTPMVLHDLSQRYSTYVE